MSYGKPDIIAGIANLKPAYCVTPKDSGWSDTAFAWSVSYTHLDVYKRQALRL